MPMDASEVLVKLSFVKCCSS